MENGISSIMFKKIAGFITRHKEGEITPNEAEKIQKASYALCNTEVKKKFSPTYLSILNGLESEDKQVFEASLYYLTKIAQNKPKYQSHIIDKLQQKMEEEDLSPQFVDLIKQYLESIKNKKQF